MFIKLKHAIQDDTKLLKKAHQQKYVKACSKPSDINDHFIDPDINQPEDGLAQFLLKLHFKKLFHFSFK